MDERAAFETRAVLAPGRARRSRLLLLVPAIALLAITWAGLSGERPTTPAPVAEATGPAATEILVPTDAPDRPATALGLTVRAFEDVQPGHHPRGEVIALAGWYVATAITDCPPVVEAIRIGSSSGARGDTDALAYCDRAGLLYAAPPSPDRGSPGAEGTRAIDVSVVLGVVMPPELEVVGAAPTEVVVLGRFVESGYGCGIRPECRQVLLLDYVAWTPAWSHVDA